MNRIHYSTEEYGNSNPLDQPIVHARARRRFPDPVRIVLRLIGADDYMQFTTPHAKTRRCGLIKIGSGDRAVRLPYAGRAVTPWC
jgi:hypothetical protein